MIIKLFEQYSHKYYTEISYTELIDFMEWDTITQNYKRNILSFTPNEVNQLQSLIPYIQLTFDIRKTISEPHVKFILHNKDHYILKYPDEWFVIHIIDSDKNYYKCDQISGLIQCINDLYNMTP